MLGRESGARLRLTGANLRGSGVDWDIRRERPYAAYAELEFDVPVAEAGDVYARCAVRLEEMRQSARIIRQCLDGLPEGEHTAKVAKVLRPPAGETYAAVESPRGELGIHLVSDGSDSPYRMRYRPPALYALQAGEAMLPGILIADAVVLMGSMDLVLGRGGPMNPWLSIASFASSPRSGSCCSTASCMIYMLRKVLGRLHIRLGPMDNGPYGMFQTVFDVLKLLTKEDPTPARRRQGAVLPRAGHRVRPVAHGLHGAAVLPTWVIADLPYGLLFVFAVMSFVPLGILAAGWASNNKWSLVGAHARRRLSRSPTRCRCCWRRCRW